MRSMTKSLVTGGCGFIGSHIVDYLAKLGQEVVVVDNRSANNDRFYENDQVKYLNADITDYSAMSAAMEGVDYVFHLAAESRLQPAIKNPIDAVTRNCVGTTVLLQAARNACVRRFVYSSTSSGYGNNPAPSVETQPDDCLNPYSASKVAAEKFCKMYTDLYGLDTVCLRYFNVFGERSPTRGQYAPVIGIFEKQKEAGEPLTIVGDGSQKRDFVYVGDVARANYLASIMPLKGHNGEVFNVGSGKNYSIQEIADLISPEQKYLPKREGEMETTLANIDKIKSVIGWVPEVDVLEWIENDG